MSIGVRPPSARTVALAFVAVGVVVVWPALGLGYGLFRAPAALTSAELWSALPLLRDSLLLSVAVAVSATLLGGWLAWIAERLRYPGRSALALFALLPLATPSYLLAATFERAQVMLLGPSYSLRGLVAAWLVLTLVTAPVVQLVVASALQRSSANEEEAARSLGASRVALLRSVVLPRVQAGMVFGFVLSFVYALSDFGAVAVLDAPVLTFRLYQAVASHQLGQATLYGLLLSIAAVPLLLLAGRLRGKARAGVANPRAPARLPAGTVEAGLAVGTQLMVGGLGTLLPLVELARWVARGLTQPDATFASLGIPALHTVGASFFGAVLTLLLALPVTWVAARAPRLSGIRQAGWIASALPGPLLAFGWLLCALWAGTYLGLPYGVVMSSGLLLLLGYATRFLAEAAAPLEAGILHLDPRQEAAARSLGAPRSRWLLRVVAPALTPATGGAFVLVFIAILKELPVTLLLGGPAGLSTLAFRVFDRYNEAMFHDAGLAGLILLATTLTALLFTLERP